MPEAFEEVPCVAMSAQYTYRLIDLENTEIGGRCISTGPSPLDLGIGAMA